MNPINLLLKPIELFLDFLFSLAHGISGNWGLSILLLSLAVTLITSPLYYLAERWKKEDDEKKASMASELKSVKAYYSGQKRFYLIQNIHRLHGYTSLYTLKASFGLIIQIPFFFAAYNVLSHHGELPGISFWFLKDLGRPDGLLGSANLLPLLMTGINILSALLYNRSLSLRKNGNMLLMAGAFLVLLYNRPSALLLYWTSNNVLSLIKNGFFPAEKFEDEEKGREEPLLKRVTPFFREIYSGGSLTPILYFVILILVNGQYVWINLWDKSFKFALLIMLMINAGMSLVFFIRLVRDRKNGYFKFHLLHMIAWWTVILALSGLIANFPSQFPYASNYNVKLLTALIMDGFLFYLLYMILAKPEKSSFNLSSKKEYIQALLVIFIFGFYLYIFNPLRIYFSSPSDIGIPPLELFMSNTILLAGFLIVSCLVLLLVKKVYKRIPLDVLIALVVSFFLFTLFYSSRFGILDEFNLRKAYLLMQVFPQLLFLDGLIIIASLIVGRWIQRKHSTFIVPIAAILLLTGILQLVSASSGASDHFTEETNKEVDRGIPEEFHSAHTLSKNGQNIVFIIADMYNGNYFSRYLEEDPSRAAAFDGFTYYPQTLSVGSNTTVSLPAIYGGDEFSPSGAARMEGETGREYIDRAGKELFTGLVDNKYVLSGVDLLYIDYAQYGLNVLNSYEVVPYWKEMNTWEEGSFGNFQNKLLLMLSLFNGSPTYLKRFIYDSGTWIIFRQSYLFEYIRNRTLPNYAYIDLLPEMSKASSSKENRFLMIHSQLPHEPYGIDNQGEIIKGEYPNPEKATFVGPDGAYYSSRQFTLLLADWLDWMRENGVYDNTTIIVLSDHGNNTIDNDFVLPDELDRHSDKANLSTARALMLVKPFSGTGPVVINDSPMDNSYGALITKSILSGKKPEKEIEYPLTFHRLKGTWNDFLNKRDVDFVYYNLTGPMEDADSWEKE